MAREVQSCEARTHTLILPSALSTTCRDHQQKIASQILKQRKELIGRYGIMVGSLPQVTLREHLIFYINVSIYFIEEFLKKGVQEGCIKDL